MPRIRHILVVFLALLACDRAFAQISSSAAVRIPAYLAAQMDDSTNAPAAAPADSSAPAGDEVTRLRTENAALRKEVVDAAHTIEQLQARLAQSGANHQPGAVPAEPSPSPTTPDANAAPDAGGPAPAPPSGPQKALPLDATNANVNPASPDAVPSGPSRSYTVVKGDSLWKIAHKMYPHDTLNGEDRIRDANKDVFNGKFLQPGQVLVIPQ